MPLWSIWLLCKCSGLIYSKYGKTICLVELLITCFDLGWHSFRVARNQQQIWSENMFG
jgi:hypothetical protein